MLIKSRKYPEYKTGQPLNLFAVACDHWQSDKSKSLLFCIYSSEVMHQRWQMKGKITLSFLKEKLNWLKMEKTVFLKLAYTENVESLTV